MHACIYTAELKTIKLPPKMRKRGRPKGAETTVIGLPKRRKRSNKTVPFLKKLPSEREKVHSQCMCMQLLYMLTYPAVILQWFVDAASAEAAVCHKIIIEEDVVEIRPEKVTPACLEPQVCVDVCRKYFTKDAWLVVKDVISTIKRDPKWYCGRCSKQINDDIESSIQCDSCLLWFHFECIGIHTKPKYKVWFCTCCMR